MSDEKNKKSSRLRLADFLVVIIFLLIAAVSLYLFWYDLMRTINLKNIEPAGTVVVKKNTVQRRIYTRVLWDRLAHESPVYLWDLIRVAEDSAATLYMGGSSIDLEENTLIRIVLSPDGEGLQLMLFEGTLSLVTSQEDSNLTIDINGKQILAGRGTVLSASVSKDGFSIQVNEGSALFIDDDHVRDIPAGDIITIDADGTEHTEKAAVVKTPAPNARFLKTANEPVVVDFSWSRNNLEPDETLRLEVALDSNFNNIVYSIEDLDEQAQIVFDTGLWHWRISSGDRNISSGQITIADTGGFNLLSPAANSLFRYHDELPVINFQWEKAEEAVSYILQVSSTPDFTSTKINRQVYGTFLTDRLEAGSWYWRVMPVFPSVFRGSADFTAAAFFRIEKIEQTAVAAAEESSLSRWLVTEAPSVLNIQPEATGDITLLSSTTTAPPEVQPISLLPRPQNMLPVTGSNFGFDELQSQRTIVFSWSAVQGANAYIFSLYQQTAQGRIQIIRTNPISAAGYTLDNLRVLDNGTYVWQVEAVNVGRANIIERRGTAGESTFILDIPAPGQIMIEDTGILYGN